MTEAGVRMQFKFVSLYLDEKVQKKVQLFVYEVRSDKGRNLSAGFRKPQP